jgi:poly-gamma-glutamate synthesis protein (capsule biosynthesis protein)
MCDEISAADVAFVNLECPLTLDGRPMRKAGPHLKAHPDCARALAIAGFNVIGMANNHILDYGYEGLMESLASCQKNNLCRVGAGRNLEEAQRVFVIEKKGIKVAIIAVAEREFCIAGEDTPGAAPLDAIDTTYQIQLARAKADLVIVTIHGGNGYFPYPRPGLRRLCKFFIDQGADSIICHHPHVPGAFENYNGKPIVYSLGNFLFDTQRRRDRWGEGYAVSLEFDLESKALTSCNLIPYTQSFEQQGVKKMSGAQKLAFIDYLTKLNSDLYNDTYLQAWREFCDAKAVPVVIQQYMPSIFPDLHRTGKRKPSDQRNANATRFGHQTQGNTFIKRIIKELLIQNDRIAMRLNMIRCQSHREVLLQVLEDGFETEDA